MAGGVPKQLNPSDRLRGVATILAMAVRRRLQDEASSRVLSTNALNRVEFAAQTPLSVSHTPDSSGDVSET